MKFHPLDSRWWPLLPFLLAAVGCSSNSKSRLDPEMTSASAIVPANSADAGVSEETRILDYIRSRYSPADVRYTYQTERREDVDCIDYYAQASIRGLLAGGRTREEVAPPRLADVVRALGGSNPALAAAAARAESDASTDASGHLLQCPDGSVPMLRLSLEKILAVGGLDNYLRVHHRKASVQSIPANEVPGFMHVVGEFENRSMAGGVTSTSIYDPGGAANFDHSVSQSWLIAGANQSKGCTQCTSNCQQTVEAGWEVQPSVYHDTLPHIFVFTTPDGYWTTCYNGDNCINYFQEQAPGASPPWVQFSGSLPAGAALPATLIGTTPPVELGIWTFNYQNWWIVFAGPSNNGQSILYGGYLASFYAQGGGALNTIPLPALSGSASVVASYHVGGEVAWNYYQSLAPVAQGMGSGVPSLLPSSSPYGLFAYHRNAALLTPTATGLQTTQQPFDGFFQGDSNCYNLQTTNPGPGNWGTFLYFGGAGQICFGPSCNACCSPSDSLCQTLETAEQQVIDTGCL